MLHERMISKNVDFFEPAYKQGEIKTYTKMYVDINQAF